jgi:hypothetical protein
VNSSTYIHVPEVLRSRLRRRIEIFRQPARPVPSISTVAGSGTGLVEGCPTLDAQVAAKVETAVAVGIEMLQVKRGRDICQVFGQDE